MMIEMLKRLSPVPISFKDKKKMGDTGLYFDEDKYENRSPYIEIANGLEKHYEISVLVHEISHALCSEKNCKCMANRNDHTLAEYHAYKFELKWLLKHEQKRALNLTIDNIEKEIQLHRLTAHYFAAKRIIKLKLWQKCLDYVK